MVIGVYFVLTLIIVSSIESSKARVMFKNGRSHRGNLGSPRRSGLLGTETAPPDMWITQPLDHFNPSDSRTWQQRYFVNDAYYKVGGPVFLMIGGEGPASPDWMLMGQWVEFAKLYNALCLQLEHRYYGNSHPTPDISTENLAYLSSDQALADLAYFQEYITKTKLLTDNKWIVFGGSYSGALAAWFRLKYPHLVHGAIASSAPVHAKLNFYEYLEVVTKSLDYFVSGCSQAVGLAVDEAEALLRDAAGRQKLKTDFRLCDDVDPTVGDDVANLFTNLAGDFMNVVQYNKDYRVGSGSNITIDTICQVMIDTKRGSPSTRFAIVNSMLLDDAQQKCLDFKYDKMISELKQVDWNGTAAEGGRQWTYQTCTEFGYYQSSDYDNQPFGKLFPIRFEVKQCQDIFGSKFTESFISDAIKNTNTDYGGYGLSITRVAFPNGSIDPWHVLGILVDKGPNSPAILINGTAHCGDMYPDGKDDLPGLRAARMRINKLIGSWLNEA